MKQLSLSRMVAVACILCASSAGASAAQNKHSGDPARWYKGDSTQAQRLQVLKKELNAAYAEQTAACKKQKSGKQACLKEARANFERDSANARRLVANPPQAEITERVVSTTPAGGQDTTQPGASAVGGSGAAGQTGAGAGQTGMGSNPAMRGGQQSGASQTGAPSQTGAQQSGAAGYGSSQSMGAGTPPTQSGAQSGFGTSGPQSGYGSSGAGTTGAIGDQSGTPIGGPTQSGSNNSSGSQSGAGATQSMGAGTGATQSDTQDQPRAGAVPPVQR